MATAPKFFASIVQQLGRAGLSTQDNGRWRRIVIEKAMRVQPVRSTSVTAPVKRSHSRVSSANCFRPARVSR